MIRYPTNSLYRIRLNTRSATLIGNGTAINDVYEIAASPIDLQLYGIRDGTKEIVRI
ncbi:MAG: hypothetical protein R3E84_14535 [Pseudomonadales bacterium]